MKTMSIIRGWVSPGTFATVCIALLILVLTAACAQEGEEALTESPTPTRPEATEEPTQSPRRPDQVENLIAALQDEDPRLRETAASGLGLLGDARAVEALIAALEDEDWEVRLEAAGALGEIGDAGAVEPLIVALQDEASDVREEAAGALGEIGDARAVEALIAAIEIEDVRFETHAQKALREALGEIGDAAVEPLIAALQDEDPQVRWVAASALGEIRDARAVEPLIAALQDEDSDVRKMTARALGEIGDARAVEPLLAASRNGDLEVVAAAYRFFIARGEPGTESTLIDALNAHGTRPMAETFLKCGLSQLEEAAREWASSHGYEIISIAGPGGGGGLQWGSGQ